MSDWVVVVDDDALCLTNARAILGAADMRVSCLRSGAELLKFMEKNTPDIVLLDILMPEMDGFETLRALRKYEETAERNQTPVIFLTGDSDSETEQRGLKAGASDFIRKPFNQDILLRRIQNTIKNSRTIETLTEEATLDKLTGFLNKVNGTERITALCAEKSGALMLMDLDSFKLVNDLYGHDMGDRVLAAFAEIVRHNIRSNDVICRMGGDEFTGFFCDITEEIAVSALTERLNEQLLKECVALMGSDFNIPIGISVGAVMVPEHGTDYDLLFQYADSAMYHVKQNGKHGCEIYCPSAGTGNDSENLLTEIGRMSQIMEERGETSGALLLGQDSFSWNYRFIMRFIRRYHGKVNKVLFSLSVKDSENNPEEIVERFGSVLQKTLRKSDIVMRNKPCQFFVLMPQLSDDDAPGVIRRILQSWAAADGSGAAKIRYETEEVSYSEEADNPSERVRERSKADSADSETA